MKSFPFPKTKYNFFASSNSYLGFVSYFDNIFISKEFKKIFILKGGPGTGKSSIIKKAAQYADNSNLQSEVFYCSSDLNSLDGIIIYTENGKIAILDGTAPHTRDASFPGVIDEIVSLGEAWRSQELESRKNEIIEYNNQKNYYYKKAYENLYISSVFETYIEAVISKAINSEKIIKSCQNLVKEFYKTGNHIKDVRLISSFSKEGIKNLNTLDNISTEKFGIYGEFASDKIYMKMLYDTFKKTDMNYTHFPNSLDKNSIDAIYCHSSKTAIVRNKIKDSKMLQHFTFIR